MTTNCQEETGLGPFAIVAYQVVHGIKVIPTASVGIRNGSDVIHYEAACGATPQEASFRAVDRALNINGVCLERIHHKIESELWHVTLVVTFADFTAVGVAEGDDLLRVETAAYLAVAEEYKRHVQLQLAAAVSL